MPLYRVAMVGALVAILGASSPSCDRTLAPQRPRPVATDEARTFEIHVRGSAVWSEQNLRIDFLQVAQDARCPIGGMCAWAGNAILDLNATPGGAFTLRIGPQAGVADTTRAVADLAGFQYQALSLVPIANIGTGPVDPASYVVTLQVTKLAP